MSKETEKQCSEVGGKAEEVSVMQGKGKKLVAGRLANNTKALERSKLRQRLKGITGLSYMEATDDVRRTS